MKSLILIFLYILALTTHAKPVCEAEATAAQSYTSLVRLAVTHGLLTPKTILELSKMRKPSTPTLTQDRNEYTLALRRGFLRAINSATPASWRQTKLELETLAHDLLGVIEASKLAVEQTELVFTARPLKHFPARMRMDDDPQFPHVTTRDGRTLIAHHSDQEVYVRDLATGTELHKFARRDLINTKSATLPLLNLREDQHGAILLELAVVTETHIKVVTINSSTGKRTTRSLLLPSQNTDAELSQVTLKNGEHFYLIDENKRGGDTAVIHSSGKSLLLAKHYISSSQFAVSSSGASLFVAYTDQLAKIFEFAGDSYQPRGSVQIPGVWSPGALVATSGGDSILATRMDGIQIHKFGGESLAHLQLGTRRVPERFVLHETFDGKVYLAGFHKSSQNPEVEIFDVLQNGKSIAHLPFTGDIESAKLFWSRINGRDVLVTAASNAVATYVVDGPSLKLLGRTPTPFSLNDGYLYFVEGAKTPYILGSVSEGQWVPLEMFSPTSPQ